MRRGVAATALLLLASACTSGSSSSPPPPTSPTSTAPSADPFTALKPPSQAAAAGSFAALTVDRAELQVQGFLFEQLLSPTMPGGASVSDLEGGLVGVLDDPSIHRDLTSPTKKSLQLRVAFKTKASPPSVLSSTYTPSAVTGAQGEAGLRIAWNGRLAYPVAGGTITYGLSLSWIFASLANEPTGIALQVVQRGAFTATPSNPGCEAKGLLALPSVHC